MTPEKPAHSDLVNKILAEVCSCKERGIIRKLSWVSLHVRITENEAADQEAKQAASTPGNVGIKREVFSLKQFNTLLNSEAKEAEKLRTNTQ